MHTCEFGHWQFDPHVIEEVYYMHLLFMHLNPDGQGRETQPEGIFDTHYPFSHFDPIRHLMEKHLSTHWFPSTQ